MQRCIAHDMLYLEGDAIITSTQLLYLEGDAIAVVAHEAHAYAPGHDPSARAMDTRMYIITRTEYAQNMADLATDF